MADTDGLNILHDMIRLTCQTLVYGMYIIIMLICSYVMLKKGLRGESRPLLFFLLVFMFSLSTAYWILSLYQAMDIITTSFVHSIRLDDIAFTYGRKQDVMNALVLLNYVLTDGVVVWRAWVLCRDEYSKSLILPLVFLCLTLVCFDHNRTAHRNNCYFLTNLVLSLLTNVFSTSIVGIKAWHHRQWVTSELQMRRRKMTVAERVFTLLVESGIIYCLCGITVLIATMIRLPFGTLGDIYTPVNVQFAGIYPAIVILFISRQGELNETAIFTFEDKSNPLEHPQTVSVDAIEFGDNPHLNSYFGETETFADVRHSGSSVSRLSQA
ncbi:hypothetical protein DFS33DRAFT_519543 [Desarmillaria ectypa]|nr:hypothetical protein DFS33DRAFT_519543 [Desarmillaria ectypa]